MSVQVASCVSCPDNLYGVEGVECRLCNETSHAKCVERVCKSCFKKHLFKCCEEAVDRKFDVTCVNFDLCQGVYHKSCILTHPKFMYGRMSPTTWLCGRCNQPNRTGTKFKIGCLNVQGGLAAADGVKLKAVEKYIISHQFDICVICESRVHENTDDSRLSIDGYSLKRKDYPGPTNASGGLVIYFKNSLVSPEEIIVKEVKGRRFEFLALKFTFNQGDRSSELIVCGTYCPDMAALKGFLLNFGRAVNDTIKIRTNRVVVLGDFKLNVASGKNCGLMREHFEGLELWQLIDSTTTTGQLNITDHVYVSGLLRQDVHESGVLKEPRIGDHFGTYVTLNIEDVVGNAEWERMKIKEREILKGIDELNERLHRLLPQHERVIGATRSGRGLMSKNPSSSALNVGEISNVSIRPGDEESNTNTAATAEEELVDVDDVRKAIAETEIQ